MLNQVHCLGQLASAESTTSPVQFGATVSLVLPMEDPADLHAPLVFLFVWWCKAEIEFISSFIVRLCISESACFKLLCIP